MGGERRERRRGGRAALVGDSKEVIETLYNEELYGRRAGCEYSK